jgi:ParB family transcriptional regulator, chromosome partitioning protein
MADGHVLRYAVEQIQLGHTYREDLGDIDGLCESIRTVGLLHPVVLSSDGLLISGRRRLEAVRRLGWREVDVWVAAKVSTRLRMALAVRDENTLRKELNPVEAAALYAELKTLYTEEAARRQAASRFGAQAESHGAVDSTAPVDSRVQAARAITGRDSHGMLEQVLELQRIAADDDSPNWLREQTESALAELSADGKVNGRYLAIKGAQARHELEAAVSDPSLPDDIRQAAQTDLDQVSALPHPHLAARAARRAVERARSTTARAGAAHTEAAVLVRKFAAGMVKRFGWWDLVDPETVATYLAAEQWDLLVDSWNATRTFMERAIAAREQERGKAGD